MAHKFIDMKHEIEERVQSYTSYKLNFQNLKDSFYNGILATLAESKAKLDYLRYTVALMSKELLINGEYMEEKDRDDLENAIWNAEQLIIALEAFVATIEELG